MHHFFAPGENGETGRIRLTGRDVKHITRVLRLKEKDQLIVSDGQDRDYLCEIRETGPDFVLVDVLEACGASAEPRREILLFQGLPKGDKMDFIIEKAVELGVCRLVPVAMERSVVKLDPARGEKKRERWQLKAESAAKQCGRSRVPEVSAPMDFPEALKLWKDLDRGIVPYESAEDMTHTRRVLEAVPEGASVGFFIGPEGGFDPREIEALQACGAHIITLGPRILRTETAGPAVLAMATLLWEV